MSALTGPWCPGKVTAILSEGSLALRLQLNELQDNSIFSIMLSVVIWSQ